MENFTDNNGFWGVVGGTIVLVVREAIARYFARPTELKQEIIALKAEVSRLNKELECWRGQFYYLLNAAVRNDKEALTNLLDEYIKFDSNKEHA